MPDRIFIVGCARSGTTLLRRLFHAFEDVEVVPREVTLDEFAAMESPEGKTLVGKRTFDTIFSNCLPVEEGRRQLKVLHVRPDIRVLCIYRDGRDAVESETRATPVRWYESMRQMRLAQDANLLPGLATMKYEDMVSDPDGTQAGLANWFGLTPAHKWSEYPAFFSGDDHQDIYPPQPIGTHRVAKDLKKYRRLDPWLAPRMDRMLRHLGYLEGESHV